MFSKLSRSFMFGKLSKGRVATLFFVTSLLLRMLVSVLASENFLSKSWLSTPAAPRLNTKALLEFEKSVSIGKFIDALLRMKTFIRLSSPWMGPPAMAMLVKAMRTMLNRGMRIKFVLKDVVFILNFTFV
ncbi:secreted protein [Bathymodiolus azoricus thioautotrophic gill symbiont]|uniref:Secreted protein n=1 Tax=Bathymodiolus azoricus thioautotrophic gill symbiont TaxID=235205 RepID=A0A1H6KTK3_9GAMM|nr:secreted protein [Bathymodiolus azoricus thioautotrophic gill symbiont]